nr:MAG TPA: Helix-turn-helix XRE-family like protein [Caudoviricetes sp.]
MSITLKAARVNRNLNQKEAAKLIGVSVSTLQNYESGKCFPDVPVIKSIERVYQIHYADISFLSTNNA